MPASENEDESSAQPGPDAASAQPDPGAASGQLDPNAAPAVLNAYYTWLFSRPDMARNRAQAAYGIASAIAATLVALGILGKVTERPLAVQILSLLALCAWLVTSILFVWAVSGGEQPEKIEESRGTKEFIIKIITASQQERTGIDGRLKYAVGAAAVAAALTVIALGAIVRVPATVKSVNATVSLSEQGREGLAAICGSPQPTVQGQVTEASLKERFITITVDPKSCQGHQAKLYLPAGDVLRIAANMTDR